MKLPPILSYQRKRTFFLLVGNGLLQAISTISVALLIKYTFDGYFITPLTPTLNLWYVSSAFLFIASLVSWLKYRERVDSEYLGQHYVHELRIKMFSEYCKSNLRIIDKKSKGAIGLRFATDLSSLRQWISLGLSRLTVSSINLTITLTALSFINLSIGVGAAFIILLNILLSLSVGKQLREAVFDARKQRSYLANNINEKISSIASVKAFGQRQREKNKIKHQSERLIIAMGKRAQSIGILRAITEGSGILLTAATLIIGSIIIGPNQVSPGTIVAAIGIVGLLAQPIRHLGRTYEYFHNANVAKEKIQSFLTSQSLVQTKRRKFRQGRGRLILEHVAFFPNGKNHNLRIQPGNVVSVLGANGAGKSTILSQIAGLLSPTRGKVLLGRNNVCKLKDSALRSSIGTLSQDLPLLKGSIKNNICYRRPNATEEEVSQAIKSSGLETFLQSLPNGINTKIAEGGKGISQGERQRISLARAIIGTPELLILDEADSFLDDSAKTLFIKIINNYPGIIIMTTHNINHLATSSIIWVVEKGDIVWNGKRSELASQHYTDLFDSTVSK